MSENGRRALHEPGRGNETKTEIENRIEEGREGWRRDRETESV